MPRYQASGATDIGQVRANNEDAFLIKQDIGVFAVADGMGGAAAGEVASAIFVQTVDDVFRSASPASADEAAVLVREVFQQAHERMIDDVAEHPSHEGMGCTAELLLFSGDSYVLGHLGDSRTYLFREGELRQITKDHSFVQQQVELGLIPPSAAKRHPMKNIVLKALGPDFEHAPDLITGSVFPSDLFLLCSDGLTDLLEDEVIRGILASRRALSEMVELLVEGAKSVGGRDNITAVLCLADPAANP